MLGETQAPGSLPGAKRVYRSPVAKLAIKFEQSRDSWKAKHHAVKRKFNKLLERMKVVRQRREYWKALALAASPDVASVSKKVRSEPPAEKRRRAR